VADIFQEVDEDLRRDKALAFWKKYQNHIIGFAIIAVAATAGFSGWKYWKQQRIEANGAAYLQALQTLQKDPKAAAPQFETLAKDGGGFAVLARFQQASQTLKDGDKAKAAEQFSAIAKDGSVDKALKDLAAVQGGLAWLDAGKPEDAAKLVEGLTGDNEPYRYSALEVQAQAALAAGDKAKAKTIYEQLKQLGALPNAPQGVAARAEIMLERLKD
jgi:hypothetical protein